MYPICFILNRRDCSIISLALIKPNIMLFSQQQFCRSVGNVWNLEPADMWQFLTCECPLVTHKQTDNSWHCARVKGWRRSHPTTRLQIIQVPFLSGRMVLFLKHYYPLCYLWSRLSMEPPLIVRTYNREIFY